jgi:SAM-dependent methyltransferase
MRGLRVTPVTALSLAFRARVHDASGKSRGAPLTQTKKGHESAEHDWRDAGEAWGHAAVDWACLYEHYAVDVLAAMCTATGVAKGRDVLDVACGAGYGMRFMRGYGATVAGLDASENLLTIARERNPDSDIRLGSMFELPWADASFDIAISVNGIWGGCGAALMEMRRVLRPSGRVAISFWGDGSGAPLDMRPTFRAYKAHVPPNNVEGMRVTNRIATPGVAEEMLTDAGFEVVERGARVAEIEWADEDMAWRALTSSGPAVPALENTDHAELRADLLAALAPCRNAQGMYRYRNDHQYVIARAV